MTFLEVLASLDKDALAILDCDGGQRGTYVQVGPQGRVVIFSRLQHDFRDRWPDLSVDDFVTRDDWTASVR